MIDDEALRAAALAYLDELLPRSGGFATRAELEAFTFEGVRIPLIDQSRGIRKPRQLDAALSILTSPRGPYDDAIGPDGYFRYKWRGTDPDFFDNRALRLAMTEHHPLIWFRGVTPGVFNADFPVFLVGEEPDQHQFIVALDDLSLEQWRPELAASPLTDPVRRYAEVLRKERLHQKVFRPRVLVAYDRQCTLCRLRIVRLLDAAHIKEDSAGGEPVVSNGLAMCAIHHRAFDAQVLGIRPDYRVEIRSDVLTDHDGPTLQHTLQEMHGSTIVLPRRRTERPNVELLEERYERFRAAG